MKETRDNSDIKTQATQWPNNKETRAFVSKSTSGTGDRNQPWLKCQAYLGLQINVD